MKIFEGNSIKKVYTKIVKALKQQEILSNQTKELTNACFIVHNPSTSDLHFGMRDISEDYSNAELKWYWSGDNKCETIGKHAKMWLRLSDDGITNNSAYGYILFKKYGFNQLKQIIELLKKDNNTRRAVLNISDPTIDRINTKDMQCTIALQFLIKNGHLEETVYMRSNDIYFGTPYDYIFFVSIGEYIAKQLGLKLELYTHHATSLHMYVRDIEKFKRTNKSVTVNVDEIIKNYYERNEEIEK